jgi:glycosyltransferase involved in cell wall biosynthesis
LGYIHPWNAIASNVHILHLISSLSPADGGPPEALRQLSVAYQQAGHTVEIACLDQADAPFLKTMTCQVHALGPSHLGRYSYSPRLVDWLRANAPRFDVMVVNGLWHFLGTALRRAARRKNRPYGVFVHGGLDPWFNKQYPLKHLKKAIYWPIQYPVLRDAKAVFFTTEAESQLAKQSFRPHAWRSVVVPYGIGDPQREATRPHDAPAQVEKFYAANPDVRGRRFLLFLGRIHQKKGCDILIQAFARIASGAPDVDLVFAGPDQVGMQGRLQQLAENLGLSGRVHWPGLLWGDLKWGALRACEAFLLPSHQENFGISVVEALSVGRPVLISNQVNIWKDIVADRVGLVDDDTLEGTERLLHQWCAFSAVEREEYASGGRDCFLRRYSVAHTVEAIAAALMPTRTLVHAASLHANVT